jgi:hypothetical protein
MPSAAEDVISVALSRRMRTASQIRSTTSRTHASSTMPSGRTASVTRASMVS